MSKRKKIILWVIVCAVFAVLLFGGIAAAKILKNYYTLDLSSYETMVFAVAQTPEEFSEAEKNSRITYPTFKGNVIAYSWVDYDIRLIDCYSEIQEPCFQYALSVYRRYGYNAELTFTVENTGKLLTIKFTGTGYPENGEPEPLEQTYIFDIDGAGIHKLPKLVNRAEIIGY